MQQYRLLRNNKEAGPYTFNELITLGLKPYDLVWVEGKSAAWKYSSEIEELKSYAPVEEEQPFERFYKKKTEQKNTEEEKTLITERQKTKPRYRIRADWQKVEAGKETLVSTTTETAHSATTELAVPEEPKWKKLYSNWQQTKEETPEEITSANVLSNWQTHEQKTLQQKKPASHLSIAFGILLIGGAGLYSGFQLINKHQKQSNLEPVAQLQELSADSKNETTSSIENTPQNQESVSFVNQTNQPTESLEAVKNSQNTSSFTSNKNKTEPANKPVASVEKASTTQEVKIIPEKKNQNTATTTTSTQTNKSTIATGNAIISTTKKAGTITAPSAAKKKMEDFVTIKKTDKLTGNGIQNIHLSIENKTDAIIDFVAVDVTYFDKSGKQQQTETLYAQNLAAHHSIAIKVPDSKNAVSISYKTSLLNIKKQGIYLMAE